MKELTIRAAREDDWEAVWFLLNARGAADSEERARVRFMVMVDSADHFIPIAMNGQRAVGYGWVQDYGSHLRTGRKLTRMHDLFVLADYRNRGIAAALFADIRLWAERRGASWLQWNANEVSAGFYQKLGYTPEPEEEAAFPFFEITLR